MAATSCSLRMVSPFTTLYLFGRFFLSQFRLYSLRLCSAFLPRLWASSAYSGSDRIYFDTLFRDTPVIFAISPTFNFSIKKRALALSFHSFNALHFPFLSDYFWAHLSNCVFCPLTNPHIPFNFHLTPFNFLQRFFTAITYRLNLKTPYRAFKGLILFPRTVQYRRLF